MKAETDKLDINKLVNVPTSLNNWKTKVDVLDVGELQIVLICFKKLSHSVNNEVMEKTVNNKLKAKVNKLNKKVLDATTLIDINR